MPFVQGSPGRGKLTYKTDKGYTTYDQKSRSHSGPGRKPKGAKVRERPSTVTTVDSDTGSVSTTVRPARGKESVPRAQRRRLVKRANKQALALQRSSRRKLRRTEPSSPRLKEPAPHITPPPRTKVARYEGKSTAGTPTFGELEQADLAGKLKVNRAGAVVTPKVSKASRQLTKAKRLVKRAAPTPLPGLDREGQKVARKVLREGERSGATRKELVAAAMTGLVETGGFHNLQGGDLDSEGWRQERTSQYGDGPTGANNVRASARRFFEESVSDTGGSRGTGMTAGQLAQAIQGSAFPERYDERRPEAAAIVKAFKGGRELTPAQQAFVKKAQTAAAKVGLPGAKAKGVPNVDVIRGKKPNVVYVRADAKGAVQWARAAVGTKEGTAKQVGWASLVGGVTDPWCSVFIAANMKRRGLPAPGNPSHSSTWLDWKGGRKLPTNDLSKAKPGDILVFDWGSGGETDHTALYAGSGRMIGGNESNEVQENDVPADNIVGIVRPRYRGGKVAVKASTQLPTLGATPGSIVLAPAGGDGGAGSVSPAVASYVQRLQGGKAKRALTPLQRIRRLRSQGIDVRAPGSPYMSASTDEEKGKVLAELEKRYGVSG